MSTPSMGPGFHDDPPKPETPLPPPEPMSLRQFAAVLLWVVVADLTLYRAVGYAGPAVFFAAAAAILAWGRSRGAVHPAWKIMTALAALVCLRLVYCGSGYAVTVGLLVLLGLAMTLAGAVPLVLETVAFIGQVILGATRSLSTIRVPGRLRAAASSAPEGRAAVLLPLAAFAVFGSLFVLANPDLLSLVSTRLQTAALTLLDWLLTFSPLELLFWALAGWIGLGLIRPAGPLALIGPAEAAVELPENRPAPLYAAVRNTLATVIALFAAYLLFEYSTLWFREFPLGFYYAGYAHQGAMWLTVALALATATLSFALGKTTAGDPRRNVLQGLAWVWSFENLLLAAAVYNRLAIYVDYNGMTRMRVIGIFGVTAVLIGFLMVIFKITNGKSFWWLIRAQLATVALLVVVHSVTPVDYLVHRFNVHRVLAGDLKPSVQIAVKEKDTGGYLPLLLLLDHEDRVIREGVHAMLRQKERRLQRQSAGEASRFRSQSRTQQPPGEHWSAYQWADRRLLEEIEQRSQLRPADQVPASDDREAVERFIEYAMQWY